MGNRTVGSLTVAVVGVLVASAPAQAQKRKRKARKPTPATAAAAPAKTGPAACSYRVSSDGRPTNIKDCRVLGNGLEFDVRVARGQPVFVRLDEPIQTLIPNEDPYVNIGTKDGASFAVYEVIADKIPAGWSSTISTSTYTVTLRLGVVAERGDSQIHIARADRADRDAEVERRIAEAKAELQAKYKRDYDALDKEAAGLARRHTVKELQRGYSTARPGLKPTRHDFLVLRAEGLIRVGTTRYLKISIENRDQPTLHIASIRVWLQRGDARESVDVIYDCATTALRAGQRTTCTLGPALTSPPTKRDRLRIRVDGRDGKRSVTLGGIRIR